MNSWDYESIFENLDGQRCARYRQLAKVAN